VNDPTVFRRDCFKPDCATTLFNQRDSAVESTFSHFGPDGRHIYRPRLAAARLERAAFGTSGWRVIGPDANGEWMVGETERPPLPLGPR
jgi:hypothetical protein